MRARCSGGDGSGRRGGRPSGLPQRCGGSGRNLLSIGAQGGVILVLHPSPWSSGLLVLYSRLFDVCGPPHWVHRNMAVAVACSVLAVGTLANLTLQSALVSCPAADVSKQWSGRGVPVRSQRGRRGCARIAIDDARAGARPSAVLVGCPCAARWTDRERAYGMPTPCWSPNAA